GREAIKLTTMRARMTPHDRTASTNGMMRRRGRAGEGEGDSSGSTSANGSGSSAADGVHGSKGSGSFAGVMKVFRPARGRPRNVAVRAVLSRLRPTANCAQRPRLGFVMVHKHPTGLVPLFFTEMWERFSFYSMVNLLT